MPCLKLRISILRNVEAYIGFAYVYLSISYNALLFLSLVICWTFERSKIIQQISVTCCKRDNLFWHRPERKYENALKFAQYNEKGG